MLAVESSVYRAQGRGRKYKKKVKENNAGIEREMKYKSESERNPELEREGEMAERDGTEKEPLEAILSLDS